jgi:hypothetical protein
MEVITIESQAFKELNTQIRAIAKFVFEHQTSTINPDDEWVDSSDVCRFLKISERTLQRLRSNGIINYSILSGKTYYKIREIKRILNEKRIRSTDECLTDLVQNHQFHAEQRRYSKANR